MEKMAKTKVYFHPDFSKNEPDSRFDLLSNTIHYWFFVETDCYRIGADFRNRSLGLSIQRFLKMPISNFQVGSHSHSYPPLGQNVSYLC